jgi:outer membrane protein assembly factor BamE (lipoprotein component of BamABCDE complex)
MGYTISKCVFGRLVLVAALGVGLSACSPDYQNHGYIPPADELAQITVGVDTRATVEETIGVPATSGVVNESGFYYVSSRKRTVGAMAPKEIERTVLAISFNEAGTVTNIETFGLDRGQVVPLTRRVTTSGVRDRSFVRQLLGNIGRFNPAGLAG